MPEALARELLARAYCGRLATVGADGWPYVVPLLHVFSGDTLLVHNTGLRGHLRANIERDPRVCYEADEPGEVFPYGRFECDTSISYRSVVAFGRARIVADEAEKSAFFDALMGKYADRSWERPKSVYPRLADATVYAIAIEKLTGKEGPLPSREARWPAVDNTKSPNAGR